MKVRQHQIWQHSNGSWHVVVEASSLGLIMDGWDGRLPVGQPHSVTYTELYRDYIYHSEGPNV